MRYLLFLGLTSIFCFCKKEHIPIIVPPDPPIVIDTPIIELGKIYMLRNGQPWDFPLKTKKYTVNGVHCFGLSGRKTGSNGIEEYFGLVDIPYKYGKFSLEIDSTLNWGNSIPQSSMSWILDGDQGLGGLEVNTSKKNSNFIEVIRYDSVQNIAEGRFQVSLKNLSSHPLKFGLPDSLNITEGKFHVIIPK